MNASAQPLKAPLPIELPSDRPGPLNKVEDRGSAQNWLAGLRQRLSAAEAELSTFRPREDELRSAIKDQVSREQDLTVAETSVLHITMPAITHRFLRRIDMYFARFNSVGSAWESAEAGIIGG